MILLLLLSIDMIDAQIASFSIHFDSLLKKLLKIGGIYDSIFGRKGTVQSKLQDLLPFFCATPPPPPPTSFFTGTMMAGEAEGEVGELGRHRNPQPSLIFLTIEILTSVT